MATVSQEIAAPIRSVIVSIDRAIDCINVSIMDVRYLQRRGILIEFARFTQSETLNGDRQIRLGDAKSRIKYADQCSLIAS